jgi:2-amino-4-hydroxy-6-hydroxymethyldihydropteridine diphosphokinase
MSADAGPVDACVALGSNLGDRRASIRAALDAIAALPEAELVAAAEPIETAPVTAPGDDAEQPAYLNTVALVRTTLGARALLEALLRIERELGRDRARERRWGPRVIDLDLLLFGGAIIDEPGLTVPHPRMHERRFVLEPLARIAPHAAHPTLGRTAAELLADLTPDGPTVS